ncbi:MAG: hypothetical protein HZB68_03920 [Candidatus Aenigmarchaeota archaeon]|nr:hypothetical protein [Candidatus Aenigmarchaeota archaeon]
MYGISSEIIRIARNPHARIMGTIRKIRDSGKVSNSMGKEEIEGAIADSDSVNCMASAAMKSSKSKC